MKTTLLSLSLVAALGLPAFAETALDIATNFDQQKITALKAIWRRTPRRRTRIAPSR